VDDLERTYLVGWLLDVLESDDGVAGLAVEEDY
jgi:hypothetical protein